MGKHKVAGALSSLTAKLLVVIVLYAAVLVVSFSAVSSAVNDSFYNAFPSMDSVLEYQDALEDDRFDALTGGILSRCEMAIFDSSGQRLFASSRLAASDLTYAFVKSLGEYDSVEAEDLAGLPNCIVEKHDYQTTGGQDRTLVLASPILNESAYAQIVSESYRLWLILVPIVVIATIAAGAFTISIVKRAVKPLDDAISSYRHGDKDAPAVGASVCTELVPIRDNFIELMSLLQSETENKQRLMADISHDLKTPLTVIRGYALALQDGRIPASESPRYLSVIAERSVVASLLLDDLFAYSKMEHPSYRVTRERADVLEEIRRVARAHAMEAEKNGCRVELDIPDKPLEILVDTWLLNRALSNLLDNAIRHSGNDAVVKISCNRADSSIVIQVANTGRAIPEAIRTTIFDPFVTGDAARMTGRGTGLGLAIAQKCIELNNGRIHLMEDPPAPFTTAFVCEFPAIDT